ncbi:hypothetical protein PHYBOEH_000438 [Phytophthora boehmeriae]|uniref:Uncharacterized protein n=1 Tax=Phytophthora boehmeriae TaxID=109152 RepID=A0A8T1WUV0_9STRA|nr:hypothetical protein PHYBOEH_000438 [Phytophthora boehmeriae]
MRTPTKIRTPTKLVLPRETHWLSRNKDFKKRSQETSNASCLSGLQPPKRLKSASLQPQDKTETQGSSGEKNEEKSAVEASQETKEEQENAEQEETLERRVQVARCLEEELLRDNTRMRLKALYLREEVNFYYELLARIELVTAQERQQSGDRKQQVMELADKLQKVISAPKPVEESTQ